LKSLRNHIVVFYLLIGQVLLAGAQDLSPAEIDAQLQQSAEQMLEISPSSAISSGITNPDAIKAYDDAKKKLHDVDYLMETIDDAYTMGDFEKAEALIKSAKGISAKQQKRCDEILLAISRERQAQAYAQAIRAGREQVTNAKPVHHESFFASAAKSPWTWVIVGGLVAGGATYYYLNQEPKHEKTVSVQVHW
jgi:hypothetical protein